MRAILAIVISGGLALVAGAAPRAVSELAALIDAAPAGTTVVVPPGEYHGRLRIDKPIVLDGEGRATIDGGGEGDVIEIACAGVTVRGLRIRGTGKDVSSEPAAIRALAGETTIEDNQIDDALFGVDLREAPNSVVRRNTIRGKDLEPGRRGDGVRLWWSHGCVVEDNRVDRTRDLVFWYSEDLTVARNHVTGSRYGLHFMYSHSTEIVGNELTGNSVGVYLMYSNRIRLTGNVMTNNRGASGYGIGLKDCDDITLEGNALLANRVGLYIDNSPSSVDSAGVIVRNLIAFNEIGFLATPNTHDNRISGNAFVENEEQAATNGRGDLARNTFSADGAGNFWSDYAGFDLDGDGRGDLAYEPRSLFSSLMATQPNLRLFVHSPAQQAVEFTARALPELRPSPMFTDPAPLARRPALDLPTGTSERSAWPMATLGAALVGGAAMVCLALTRDGRLHVGERRIA